MELIVATAVIVVALSFLLPSFNAYFTTNQLTIAARDISSLLNSARILAVSRDEPALVDFLDSNGNPTYTAGLAQTMRITNINGALLQSLEARSLAGVAFAIIPTSDTSRIRFNSRGALGNSDTADAQIRISNQTGTMDIMIARSGRIQIIDNRAQ